LVRCLSGSNTAALFRLQTEPDSEIPAAMPIPKAINPLSTAATASVTGRA